MATATAAVSEASAHTHNVGRITQVIGSTFDAEFPEDHLPDIYHAVKIVGETKGIKVDLTGEVQQHMGGGRVRCVALGGTDGLVRGQECIDTGAPVSVPVGDVTLGRVFNLLGEPIDERGPVEAAERWPIHRESPQVSQLIDQYRVVRDRNQGHRSCSRRSCGAARPACLAVPAWERRSFSPN